MARHRAVRQRLSVGRPSRGRDATRRRRGPVATICAFALLLGSTAVVLAAEPTSAVAATRGATVTAAADYGKARGYLVAVSVLDRKTGALYSAGPHTSTFATESVVKTFIAARLLVEGRMHGTTASRAYTMITQSDDAIANSFYGSVGGDSLINWVKSYFDVPSLGSPPRRAGWWGNTHITSDGLVRLYAKFAASKVVGPWLLNAMHHAKSHGSDGFYQWFGLHSANSSAAIKQGWGLDYDDWDKSADENTTGFVDGDRYAVAILARGPSNTYGTRIGDMLTATAKILLPGGQFPDATPVISSLSATAGGVGGGTTVTIHGSDLTHLKGVFFGSRRSPRVRLVSSQTLTAVAPPHWAGPVTVQVQTWHGNSGGSASRFTYYPGPSITKVAPTSGSTVGRTTVTITGRDFTRVSKILFGSTAARIVKVSFSSAEVVTPAHVAGRVQVRVVGGYGTSGWTPATVYVFAPQPTITAVTVPGSATSTGPMAGGTTVRITGTGLARYDAVFFGTTAGTVDRATATTTSLTVTAPAHAAGRVEVSVRSPYGAAGSYSAYTYIP